MSGNAYETAEALNEYLLFHYGNKEDILPYARGPVDAIHFAERAVTETFDWSDVSGHSRALDLGCAVGGSSFALSRYCGEVIGIDASAVFIRAARQLATSGRLTYERREEGELTAPLVACPPPGSRPERIRFEVGDATNLRPGLGVFQLVLAANLICRLPRPAKLLEGLFERLAPGGQLVITSPYTWLEDFTPRSEWLGGFPRNGVPLRTLDALREQLEPSFALEEVRDLPFLIREHARKFQWSVAHATRWRRL